jgi:arginase
MSSRLNTSLGLIKYASNLGQCINGVQKTPAILAKYIAKNKMDNLTSYNTRGNINWEFMKKKRMERIAYDNFSLSIFMKDSLKYNDKTLVLGGDHSLGIGSVEGVLSYDPNSFIVWIDAHADINTPETSKSKNIHGMPLAYNCNFVKNNFQWLHNYLDPSRLIYLGLRDVDDYEKEVLKNNSITNYSAKETINNLPDIMNDVCQKIGDNNIHVSLDVDAFDPKVIPSTGTPAANGLQLEHFQTIMNKLDENNKVGSVDIAELNLKLGTEEDQKLSLQNTLKIIDICKF